MSYEQLAQPLSQTTIYSSWCSHSCFIYFSIQQAFMISLIYLFGQSVSHSGICCVS